MSWSFAPNMTETWDATQIPKSFSFEDLDAVPFDSYANQKGCNTELLKREQTASNNCPTRIHADYQPTLAVPTHATGLAEQFRGCSIGPARNAIYVPITATKVAISTSRTLGVTVPTSGFIASISWVTVLTSWVTASTPQVTVSAPRVTMSTPQVTVSTSEIAVSISASTDSEEADEDDPETGTDEVKPTPLKNA
jgi:hypothetical protein